MLNLFWVNTNANIPYYVWPSLFSYRYLVMSSKAYLGFYQISMMELFYENSWRLKIVNGSFPQIFGVLIVDIEQMFPSMLCLPREHFWNLILHILYGPVKLLHSECLRNMFFLNKLMKIRKYWASYTELNSAWTFYLTQRSI